MTDDHSLGRRGVLAGAGSLALATLAGCSTSGDATGNETTTSAGAGGDVATIQVSPSSASVGEPVTVGAQGLPPNATLALEWQRITGHWAITQSSTVHGAQFTTSRERLASVDVDGRGAMSTTITVPEDHGGDHVLAVTDGSTTLAKGTVTLSPTFAIDRTSAPLGEPFTVEVTGMPVSKYRRVDQILWDNKFTGLVTGVTNRGSVRAKVPAVGPPGPHVVEVGGGYEGVTYLNPQQSPYPRDFRYAHWTVTVEPPTAEAGTTWRTPSVEERPLPAFYPTLDDPTGTLTVTPTSGVVGAEIAIDGSGLPATTPVTLEWVTMTGSRVSGNGFSSTTRDLTTVRTDARGAFSTTVPAPDDLGGTHPIVARVDGATRAVAGFVVQPSIADIGPASGPVGTPIDVHLKGVGWTEYDNIYAVTYDNDFVGYGCGFNTGGDVQMQFRASGRPGLHVIDCVPAMYKTPDEQRTVGYYTKPQLTYLDDHPVRTLPEIGFLFEVTS